MDGQGYTTRFRSLLFLYIYTVINLITKHAPVSEQSSNLVVFRLQPVYFYLLLYKNVYDENQKNIA